MIAADSRSPRRRVVRWWSSIFHHVSEVPERRPREAIETALGSFELLEGGVIFWTVAPGTTLSERTAQKAYDAVSALALGEPVAIIGDARDLGFADYRARSVLADSDIKGRVATGVIVSGRVVRFLANQYARQVGDKRPIRVFDSEVEAITWAQAQVRSAGSRGH